MMFACFALTMLVALLGVPAIKERFDANQGVFWENGMRGSSLFLAGSYPRCFGSYSRFGGLCSIWAGW